MRILSGIQPSGTIHLGNYFAMMKPAIATQSEAETFLFIADLHALTVLPDPEVLRERVFNVAVDFLACGLNPEKTVFFRHSDIHEITELMWILDCVMWDTGLDNYGIKSKNSKLKIQNVITEC